MVRRSQICRIEGCGTSWSPSVYQFTNHNFRGMNWRVVTKEITICGPILNFFIYCNIYLFLDIVVSLYLKNFKEHILKISWLSLPVLVPTLRRNSSIWIVLVYSALKALSPLWNTLYDHMPPMVVHLRTQFHVKIFGRNVMYTLIPEIHTTKHSLLQYSLTYDRIMIFITKLWSSFKTFNVYLL